MEHFPSQPRCHSTLLSRSHSLESVSLLLRTGLTWTQEELELCGTGRQVTHSFLPEPLNRYKQPLLVTGAFHQRSCSLQPGIMWDTSAAIQIRLEGGTIQTSSERQACVCTFEIEASTHVNYNQCLTYNYKWKTQH